ncbi:MAG: hypothetical protein JST93_29140 [Acidobacteria bacterium]|nr:hypothetical protein [Acidobacteriota bacterium]
MRRTILMAFLLPAMLAWSAPVESADIQPPSAWMLALLLGLGIKIFRSLGRS